MAGFFRYIQLENDFVIVFSEMETYFTKHCFGNCTYCRINELGVTPTTYPTDLRGTCFDEYGGARIHEF